MKGIKHSVITAAVILTLSVCAHATTLSSANYETMWNVNATSGVLEITSTNYSAYNTIAQSVAGYAESASYGMGTGYWPGEAMTALAITPTPIPPVLLGNESIVDTEGDFGIDFAFEKLAYRFKPTDDLTVETIKLMMQTCVGSPEFRISIQTDSSGEPSGSEVTGVNYVMTTNWNSITITPTSLYSTDVYHIVVEPVNLGGGYANPKYTLPNHGILPKYQIHSSDLTTLTSNGTWTDIDAMPVFVLVDTGGNNFGNSFAKLFYTNAHGGNTAPVSDDAIKGQIFNGPSSAVDINGMDFYISQVGSPTLPLQYVLYNNSDKVTMSAGVVVNPGDLTTTKEWTGVSFATQTLQPLKEYIIWLYALGPGTDNANGYSIGQANTYDGVDTDLTGLSYDGVNSRAYYSYDGGANWAESKNLDIFYRFRQPAPALLSNESIVDTYEKFFFNNASYKLSYKFRAPYDIQAKNIRLSGIAGGATSTWIVGIKADDGGGNPQTAYLTNSTATAMANYWNIFDIPDYTLTEGSVYHIVVQSSVMQPGGYQFNYTTPGHGIFPLDQYHDSDADVMTYNGSVWSSLGAMPVFEIETNDGKDFGNPFEVVLGPNNIHGNYTSITSDDRMWGEEITNLSSDAVVNEIVSYIRKAGNPTDPLYYTLKNVTDGYDEATGIFADPADVDAAYKWITAGFPQVTLSTGKTYRLIFHSQDTGTGNADYYEINAPRTYASVADPIHAQLNYQGLDQIAINTSNGGSTWNDMDEHDVIFKMQFNPVPTATSTPVLAWWEEDLSHLEQPAEEGKNDSLATADDLGAVWNQIGGGFIATEMDEDYYIFTVPDTDNNPGRDILVVQVYVPAGGDSYNVELYENSGSWMNIDWGEGGEGNTATVIYDISGYDGSDHQFALHIKPNGRVSESFYTVQAGVAESGTITGNINLVGVGASGLANVNVYALYGKKAVNSGVTDGSGYFSIKVPAGVDFYNFLAFRPWYAGAPDDWSYGAKLYQAAPPITLTGSFDSQSLPLFDIYKEGVIAGDITDSSGSAQNVIVKVMDNYAPYDEIAMQSNTTGAYGIHNLPPGDYYMWVEPMGGPGSGMAVSMAANVSVRDGFTTMVDFNMTSGYTVSGSFSPLPVGDTEVRAYLSNQPNSDQHPFRDYYRGDVAGGVYSIPNMPAGVYDFDTDMGPGMWNANTNITISSNATVDFSGPVVDSFVSGTIIDNTGLYSGFPNLGVYAIVTGYADVMDPGTMAYGGAVDGSGNFAVTVSSTFAAYDLIVVEEGSNNGPGTFLGWADSLVPGTSGLIISIDNGYQVSGELHYNSDPIGYYKQFGFVNIFENLGGGNLKLRSLINTWAGYTSGSFLPAGDYEIHAKSPYFTDMTQNFTLSSDNTWNFSFSVDPLNDIYVPYSGELDPPHKGTLADPADMLYVTIGDYELSSGFNTIDIRSDGLPVINQSVIDSGDGWIRYQFNLPVVHQVGSSTHYISVDLSDNAGNIYNFPEDWEVNIAAPSPTPTPVLDWWEENLSPGEAPSSTGVNDASDNSAPVIPFGTTGGGYLPNDSDHDSYRFTVPGVQNIAGHDMLRIRVYVPNGEKQYGIDLYSGDGGSGFVYALHDHGDNRGTTTTMYADVSSYSGSDWEYLITVFSESGWDDSFYICTVDLVDSGTISGTLDLIGVGASGLSNVSVGAIVDEEPMSYASTDAAGNYSVKVPAGVSINKLAAERQWNPGVADDWAYGVTTHELVPAVSVSGGGSSAGHDFEVYKEGAITGNISFSGVSQQDMMVSVYNSYGNRLRDISNTRNAYGIHNLAPGNYFVMCEPQSGYGSGAAVNYKEQVIVRDGFASGQDFVITAGSTVSGTLVPPPTLGEIQLGVYLPGSAFYGRDPLREYYRVNTNTNSFTIDNVPYGMFDIKAGDGGPSMWLPKLGVNISSPSTIVNFNNPLPVTFVAGTITDASGQFDFSTDMFGVYAVPAGSTDIFDMGLRAYTGLASGTGSTASYVVMVPTDYAAYDLLLVNVSGGDGPGVFAASYQNAVPGTSANDMTIQAGYKISGTITYNSNPLSDYDTNVMFSALKDVGSSDFRIFDVSDTKGTYSTSPYLQNGTYKVSVQGEYFNTAETTQVVNNSDLTNVNIALTADSSKDKYTPFSGYLNPCHKGTLASGSDLLYVTIDDNYFGSGAGAPVIMSDGVNVINLSLESTDDNEKRYSFNLPVAHQGPGSTRYISIDVMDNQGNIYSSGATWEVNIALPADICTTYGNTGIGGSAFVTSNPGYICAVKENMTTGTLSHMYVYDATGGGYIQAALYSDTGTRPYQLLAQGVSRPAQAGWNEVIFDPPYEVTAAGNYWLLFDTSAAGSSFAYNTGVAGDGYYYNYWVFPFLPNDLSTYGTLDSRKWSVYTELCVDSPQIYDLSKSAMPENAAPGETVVYSIDYSYLGSNMVVSDVVPPNMTLLALSGGGTAGCTTPGCSLSWSQGSASSKTSGSVWFRAKLDDVIPYGTVATNRAHAIIDENTAGIDSNIVSLPVDGVTVHKSQSQFLAITGDTMTYTLDWSVKGSRLDKLDDFDSTAAGSYSGVSPVPGWKFVLDAGETGTWTVYDKGSGDQAIQASTGGIASYPSILLDDGSAADDSDQFCTGMLTAEFMIEPNGAFGADAAVVIRSNGVSGIGSINYAFIASIDPNPTAYYTYQRCPGTGVCEWYDAVTFTAEPAEANIWYKYKVKVDVSGDDYVFNGKLWKKGEPEPAEYLYNWVDVGAAVDNNLRCDGLGATTDWRPGFGEQCGDNYLVSDHYDNLYIYKDRVVENAVLYDTVPACINYLYGDAADALHSGAVFSSGIVSWDIIGLTSNAYATRHWVGEITSECSIGNIAALNSDGFSVPVFSNQVLAEGPTATITMTVTPTMTLTVSATITETITATATETVTQTATQTVTSTISTTATGTVTETVSSTVTETATQTVTLTVTESTTPSITASATGTVTQTVTQTVTETITETVSPTVTQSSTRTTSPTTTETITESVTASLTPSVTQTMTMTVTQTSTEIATGTVTKTVTATMTQSVTESTTPSITQSVTQTVTGTNTEIPTATVTQSATQSVTQTNTEIATMTTTRTVTESATQTVTETVTSTITSVNTMTVTPTITGTPTQSVTQTNTLVNSPTSTKTVTQTVTETVTATVTQTITETFTYTETDTATDTPTETFTDTITDTPTDTITDTPTETITDTPTDTITQTETETDTFTETPTETFTDTVTETPTITDTFTYTYTMTNTSTFTETYTETYTMTYTETQTETQTYTETETFTITNTPTETETFTITATPTETFTPSINVALDRNFVDVRNGETVKIKLKDTVAGKKVYVKIYNLTGEIIRKLEHTTIAAAWDEIEWDVKNEADKQVGRGMYFIYIRTEDGSEVRKLYVVK